MRPLMVVFIAFCLGSAAFAADPVPTELKDIGIDATLGKSLPLDEEFIDETGNTVKLGSFFKDRPVAVILNYYGCPMLCGLLLNTARDSFVGMFGWYPGQQYEIVTISFDGKESFSLAAAKRASILASLESPAFRAAAEKHWHFLVGKAGSEKRLADNLGFKYKWMPEENQYAHAAALFLVSPKGKLARVLMGLHFPSNDMKLSLLEAGEGKIGTFAEKFLLFCYHYEPKDNKYAVLASRLVSIGGALTVFILLVSFLVWYIRDRRKGSPCILSP